MSFKWYRVNGDGTADVFEDTPAICARIDAGEGGWFASLCVLASLLLSIRTMRTTAAVSELVNA